MADAERPPRMRDVDPVRAAARLRRQLALLFTWAIVALLVLFLAAGGPWYLLIPLVVVGAVVAANTVMVVREDSPEASALTPGRLRQADRERDEVVVAAWRLPHRRAAPSGRSGGTLGYGAGRLTFTVAAGSTDRRDADAPDQLRGLVLIDARPVDLELGDRPTWRRPALVVVDQGTDHVIELTPAWDLAGGLVGSVLAAAWYDQLVDLGAQPTTDPTG